MRGCLYIVYPNKILHEIYLISSVDKDEILLIFIQSSRQYCCSIRVATSKKSADKRSVVTVLTRERSLIVLLLYHLLAKDQLQNEKFLFLPLSCKLTLGK